MASKINLKVSVDRKPNKTGSPRIAASHSSRGSSRTPGKFGGYISDVPNIELVRSDGIVFAYDEVQSMRFNAIQDFIRVTGGQSNFPLAHIDTGKSIEFEFESSQFDISLFEMTMNAEQQQGDFGITESSRFEAEPAGFFENEKYGTAIFGVARFGPSTTRVVIPYECLAGSISVRGLEESDAPMPGHFSVFITQATATDGKTVVYFNQSDVKGGDMVRICYQRRVVAAVKVAQTTVRKYILCGLYSHWPLYDDDQILKGIVHLRIPKVRVTAGVDFTSGYKTHSPLKISLEAIRPDDGDCWFSIICEIVDKTGRPYTMTENETVEWIGT